MLDLEMMESLRAECERLLHRQAAMESDFARVDDLKEKVAALSWENDSLRDKAQALRANVAQYQGLAMAVQRGLLQWAKTPEAARFRLQEADKLRRLHEAAEFGGVGESTISVSYTPKEPVK